MICEYCKEKWPDSWIVEKEGKIFCTEKCRDKYFKMQKTK